MQEYIGFTIRALKLHKEENLHKTVSGKLANYIMGSSPFMPIT